MHELKCSNRNLIMFVLGKTDEKRKTEHDK